MCNRRGEMRARLVLLYPLRRDFTWQVAPMWTRGATVALVRRLLSFIDTLMILASLKFICVKQVINVITGRG
jgi:hypothetical protein